MATSIIEAFETSVETRQNAVAARIREGEGWATRSWRALNEERLDLAAALFDLGLGFQEGVNILSNTRYEWVVADLAAQTCGAFVVPTYQSNLPDECAYVIADSGSVVVFVEDQAQFDKLWAVRDELKTVRHVIAMTAPVSVPSEGEAPFKFHSWSALIESGRARRAALEAPLRERAARLGPSDILTIIYTSGTTGRPKGVVLTHANMLYELKAVEQIGLIRSDDTQLLFLPLAHSFAKVLEVCWLGLGFETAIDADITRIVANLSEVRPTLLASVPRIYEKVHAKVVDKGMGAPGLKGKLFAWSMRVLDEAIEVCSKTETLSAALSFRLSIARRLVFSKVGQTLGETFGGRMRLCLSGGAPLAPSIARFFEAAGITVLEGYGLTETSAATCVNRPALNKIGTVGKALPGTEVRIADTGEIQIRGPGVMREYWGRKEATEEVLRGDGWFATGDVGEIDGDGYLRITDRMKDIIVTAGGKNVAPQNIENMLKAASPMIAHAVVHGDRRPYLTALVTLDPEQLEALGHDPASFPRSPEAHAAVTRVFDEVNGRLARYETVKKFRILPAPFEIGAELTPTLKVKRKFCQDKYAAELEALYEAKAA